MKAGLIIIYEIGIKLCLLTVMPGVCVCVRVSLLFSKCKLELELYGVEPALQTCRTMLLLWKSLYEVATDW